MVAANAEIAWQCRLFPQISLSSAGGSHSSALSNLVGGPSARGALPSLTQPSLSGGRLRSEVRLAEARNQRRAVLPTIDSRAFSQRLLRSMAIANTGNSAHSRTASSDPPRTLRVFPTCATRVVSRLSEVLDQRNQRLLGGAWPPRPASMMLALFNMYKHRRRLQQ